MPGPFVCTLPCSLPQGAENETHYTQLLGSTGAVCGEVPLPPAAAHCIFLSSCPQQSLQQRERRPSDVGDLLRVTQLGGYRARLHTQVCVAPKLSTLHITLPGISRRGEKRVPEGQTSGETRRDRKTQRPRRRKRHKSNGHTQAGSGHCNGSSPGGSHLLDLGAPSALQAW